MEFTREQRKELIHAFRPYVPDTVMGEFLGISRERIAQIDGRRRVNGKERTSFSPYDDEIVALSKQGLTTQEIYDSFVKRHILIDKAYISKTRIRMGVSKDDKGLRQIRREKSREYIRARLREFIATGRPFKLYELQQWDYNLVARMVRVHPTNRQSRRNPIEMWAKAMGVRWDGYSLNGK